MGTEHWEVTDLESLAKWQSGGTPTSTVSEYYNGDIPWLIIGDLNDGLVYQSAKTITNSGLQNSSAKLVPIDSVLIAMYGSIGKLGINKIACATNQAIAFTQTIYGGISKNYIFYYLQSVRDKLLAQGKGGAQSNISLTVLNAFPCPLPPLAEQQRIVEKLDAILPRVKDVKARLDKIISTRTKLMNAFTLNNGERGSEFGLGEFITDCTERIGINWENVTQIGVDQTKGIVPLRTSKSSGFEKYKVVRKGYFVYNPMRVNIGSIALYEKNEIAITSPDYVVFRISGDLSPNFLLSYLKSPQGLSQINNNTQGAVRERLYFENLIKITLLKSSVYSSNDVEIVIAYFNKLQKKAERLYFLLKRLEQAVLAKAFRGELAAQDPDDEPAEVLLKRILREKGMKLTK